MNAPLEFRPLTAADLQVVVGVARTVWQATYPGIISQEQIDTMLAARYGDAALSEYLAAGDRWFELAILQDQIVGFCACEIQKDEYKLDKIYILPGKQRLGIGQSLIERAGARASRLGYPAMILAVNKKNAQAIAAYRKHGFEVRESVCVDIGGGFVMDDYIMQKSL